MFILFNHNTEKYTFAAAAPEDTENFDVIDTEAKKVICGPTGTYDLEDNDLLTDEEEAEAEKNNELTSAEHEASKEDE